MALRLRLACPPPAPAVVSFRNALEEDVGRSVFKVLNSSSNGTVMKLVRVTLSSDDCGATFYFENDFTGNPVFELKIVEEAHLNTQVWLLHDNSDFSITLLVTKASREILRRRAYILG
jgi:hypothetical protein